MKKSSITLRIFKNLSLFRVLYLRVSQNWIYFEIPAAVRVIENIFYKYSTPIALSMKPVKSGYANYLEAQKAGFQNFHFYY